MANEQHSFRYGTLERGGDKGKHGTRSCKTPCNCKAELGETDLCKSPCKAELDSCRRGLYEAVCKTERCGRLLRENLLIVLTLLAVAVGFTLGFWLRTLHPSPDLLVWIGMPGQLFLRVLNMLIIPLIVGTVISGSSTLDPKSNGRISLVAFGWIVTTDILACLLAVLLTVTIQPGKGGDVTHTYTASNSVEIYDILADLLRNIFPDNIVEVGFRKAKTRYESRGAGESRSVGDNDHKLNGTMHMTSKSVGKSDSVNILGLIVICMLFGNAASRLGRKAQAFISFFCALTQIVIKIFRWFLWAVPIGVASLIAKSVASIANLQDSFSKLGMFVVVVLLATAIFQLLLMPLLLFVLTRRNPYLFQMTLLRPYLLVFATCTTAAAIPEMIYCCEHRNYIDKRVARFVIPFCVSGLSANGAAIFVVSSAIFTAQYIGLDLSVGDVIMIAVVTAVCCLASPSVPSSGLVTLLIVLSAVSIPSHSIAFLFTVDWLLDRVRSGVNVVSNCYCAAVVNDVCRDVLADRATEQLIESAPASDSATEDDGRSGETDFSFEDD